MKKINVKIFIKTAILSTISFFLTYVNISIFPNAPFLKLNFSDLPAIIATLTITPLIGFTILFLKLILTLTFKSFNPISRLSSFILSCMFILPLKGFKRKNNNNTLFLRLILSSAHYTIANVLYNYFIFLPLYGYNFKIRLHIVITCMLPFSLIKSMILSTSALILYKYSLKIVNYKT
ncbi:MAG: ECF transporter S component [Clostridiales bacterium]|nr:ECF transporter S component [Clostridiales bacterium]